MKKIIAREGLIIIGAIGLFFIFMLVASKGENKWYQYKKTAEIVELIDVTYPNKKLKSGITILESRDPTGIYVMIQKPMDIFGIEEGLKRDYPKINNLSYINRDVGSWEVEIERYYNQSGDEVYFYDRDMLLLIGIIIYPTYLLGRFIYWAIRTLKK